MKRAYGEELLESLQDVEETVAYLNACYTDSREVFLLGLRDVLEAHNISQKSSEALSQEQSDFSDFIMLLDSLGMQVQFSVKDKQKAIF